MSVLRQGLLYIDLVGDCVAGDALQHPTFLSLCVLSAEVTGAGNGAQGLKQARQVLYQMSYAPRPYTRLK